MKGKPTAVLYRPVLSGAPKSEECTFESPIGKEVFQSVTEITSVLEFAEDGKGDFEFSIDLTRILRHAIGETGKYAPVSMDNLGHQDWHWPACHPNDYSILGDVGIIRGNGVQNVQRACWNNLDTWMTSDIPTEVRWRSLNWGVLRFLAK